MCGRYTLTRKKEEIIRSYQERLETEIHDISEKIYAPNYNVAPSQDVAVIYNNGFNTIFDYHHWGLIPHWAKDKKIGYKMINSRVETVAEKPAFRNSFLHNRCLIIADGYFEWLKTDKGKVPYYFHLEDHNIFTFAGIRATWINGEEEINSCSIITTDAMGKAAKVHDRMPIILDPRMENDWINPKMVEKEHLLKLLEFRKNEHLNYYQVSTEANSPRNNYEEILKKEE